VVVGALAAGAAPGVAQAKGIPASGAAPDAAFLTVTGGQTGDRLGTALAGAGDGNGVPDLAIGSPGADRAVADGGAVDLVLGRRAGGTIDVSALGTNGFSIVGPDHSQAGLSVAAAG
jgi:hypothetical protein